MVGSDCLWLFFWLSYFQRFPVSRGWDHRELVMLWALGACSFGISTGFFGNTINLSRLIMNGGLDAYLGMPRNVLLHVCVSASDTTSWGDVLFGLGVYIVFMHPGPVQMVQFLLFVICGGLIITAFLVLIGSMSFFLGNLEGLAQQLLGALVSFSTYPQGVFRGAVQIILFTVMPAGFITFMPVQALQQGSWLLTGEVVSFCLFFGAVAYLLFQFGLKRYESGSLLGMQS